MYLTGTERKFNPSKDDESDDLKEFETEASQSILVIFLMVYEELCTVCEKIKTRYGYT